MEPIPPTIRLATIEATHAEEARDVLAAAGIAVELVEVRPLTQVEVHRLRQRPMVDVWVATGDADRARALLDRFALEGEAAALAESEEAAAMPPAPTAPAVPAERPSGPVLLAVLGLAGLVAAVALLVGADRVLAWASNRYPTVFGIGGVLLLALIYLVLRRRS